MSGFSKFKKGLKDFIKWLEPKWVIKQTEQQKAEWKELKKANEKLTRHNQTLVDNFNEVLSELRIERLGKKRADAKVERLLEIVDATLPYTTLPAREVTRYRNQIKEL